MCQNTKANIVRTLVFTVAGLGVIHFHISLVIWGLTTRFFVKTLGQGVDWFMLVHAIPAAIFLPMFVIIIVLEHRRKSGGRLLLILTVTAAVIVFCFETGNEFYQRDIPVTRDVPQSYEFTDDTVRFNYLYCNWWWYRTGRTRLEYSGIRYGYIDKTGDYVIKPQFDDASEFSGGVAIVKLDGKYGSIDLKGDYVTKPRFDYVYGFYDGMALVRVDNKYGYIDTEGNIAIEPRFGYAGAFSEGLAVFSDVPVADVFSGGFAEISEGHKYGYIDKSGTTVLPPRFDSAGKFQEGLAAVGVDNKVRYIDREGTTAVEGPFEGGREFSEGLAAVRINSMWGYIDKTGNTVIAPRFEAARKFREGLAAVRIGEKFGYIDKAGDMIIEPQFEQPQLCKEGIVAGFIPNNRWGYRDKLLIRRLDREGNFISEMPFGDEIRYSEGMGVFREDEKWGYMDVNKVIVIEPKFDSAGQFHDGLAPVGMRGDVEN